MLRAQRLLLIPAAVAALGLATLSGAAAGPTLPIPPPPTLPPVAVPAPLQPLVGVAGPAAAPVCGLVGLLPGLLGQEAASLPVDPRPFVPYLAPLLIACGSIPVPTATHTCALDKVFGKDIRTAENKVLSLLGVLPLPAPEGIAIDTLNTFDAASGNAVPSDVVAVLATNLGCTSTASAAPSDAKAPIAKAPAPVAPPDAARPVETLSFAPVTAPAVIHPVIAPPAQLAGPGAPRTVITRHAGTEVVAVAQRWHPVVTTLLALALLLIGGWAWRSERRDAHRWKTRGGAG